MTIADNHFNTSATENATLVDLVVVAYSCTVNICKKNPENFNTIIPNNTICRTMEAIYLLRVKHKLHM